MNRLLVSSRLLSQQAFSTQNIAKMSSKTFGKVSHCIFDMDGLLLDTEPIYEAVVSDILKSFDKPYPRDIRMQVMGTTEDKSAEIVVNSMKLPISVEEFMKRHKTMCKERFQDLALMPGAEALIRHLHHHKVPICIATSSSEEMANHKTKAYQELFALFHHKITGRTDPAVKNGKPAPDIFLVAAKAFPNPPEPAKCLVFEDSPNGVQAAKAAGMQSVMVPDRKNTSDDMLKDATLVLDSLEQFEPELFGLPPFKNN